MQKYIQSGIASSDVKDDLTLIDYAKRKLQNSNIDSIEQAIEELETNANEHWASLENDTQTHEQATAMLGTYFDVALRNYLESIGLMPDPIGLDDIKSKQNEFISANIEDFLTYYYEVKTPSLEHSMQVWINRNYDEAINKVLNYGTIISTLVDFAREKITQAVPGIDQSELQTYLRDNVTEIQKQYPNFDEMIGMFQRRKQSPSLDREKIRNVVESAVHNHLNDWEFDNEHFQRGVGFSVNAVTDRIVQDIEFNFDEISDSEITQEVEDKFEDTGWDTAIAYEYLYDLEEKLDEYAQEHDWDEVPDITMDQTMCDDIIQRVKYIDYNNDFKSFLNDYFPEELQKSQKLDKLIDLLKDFNFGFFSFDADFNDPEQALEQLYTYDSVDDFIEDFQEDLIDNIEVVGDDFAEWLVDNNEDYADETPANAYQKFMDTPDWNLYMQFIKNEYHDFESLTWAVGWTNEFYHSKSELIQALS